MFNIALSGINSSQKYLDVTSNNIANANTIGFKRSRAEFADIYSSSVFTNSQTVVGMGSYNCSVSQQFVQGTLSGDTGNNLDMAILGNGFFIVSNDLNAAGVTASVDRAFTRAGAFQISKDGYIVTAQGDYLQGWDVNEDGSSTSLDINGTHAIKIPEDTGAPQMSTYIGIGVNLPADQDVKDPIAFDPKNPSTYNCSTSQTIHDSLGRAHTLTYYMFKSAENAGNNTSTWTVLTFVDGQPVDVANTANNDSVKVEVTDGNSSVQHNSYYGFTMTFGPDGKLTADGMIPESLHFANAGANLESNRAADGATPATADLADAMGGGINPAQDLQLNFEASQYGSSNFTVNKSPYNDGFSTGLLTNVTVDENGVIQAEYSNGRYVKIAKVALADFANPQGLTKIGDTQWKQSINSGEATPKEANQGGAGAIKGANLELSNVDLTTQLVDLIQAQRNYQANAQSLQTQNTVMDSILQL